MTKTIVAARARKDLERISKVDKNRLEIELGHLAKGLSVFYPLSGEWKGFFKVRVGDYRLIFERPSSELIIVRYIRPRREAYR